LEIGGKFLLDPHASRVLPGFYPDTKRTIFAELVKEATIIFCVNADDLVNNRQLTNEDVSYEDYVKKMLDRIKDELNAKPKISINLVDDSNLPKVKEFLGRWKENGYEVYLRYKIKGYPVDLDFVVSEQ